MIDIKDVIKLWESEEQYFFELGEIVTDLIKQETLNYEIKPEITFRTKEMLSLIKKLKKKGKKYDEITDKLGIRIICSFNHEIKTVKKVIKQLFIIDKIDDKMDMDSYDKLAYRSIHYDVRVKPKYLKDKVSNRREIFEIQVRTLNQHAWANSAHTLSYKTPVDIPKDLNRRVYRLLSLYELADDEFDNIYNIINKNPENFIFKIHALLEGKFFKYARVDYDKKMSFEYLKLNLTFLEEFENKQQIEKNLADFIDENEEKLKSIFEENINQYYEKPLLTQPEIFLNWYCIKKYEYSYTEFWEDNFDFLDLEYIKDVWGFSVEPF